MNDMTVMTFTARGIQQILDDGGSKEWALDPKRVRKNQYVICVQNRDPADNKGDDWGNVSAPHKVGFFIGKISGVLLVKEAKNGKPKRWLIQVSEYAEVDFPDMWSGQQNPVKYTSLTALGINESDLRFKPMPEKCNPSLMTEIPNDNEGINNDYQGGITIKEAKELLSVKYDTSIDNIEIIIRG